MTRFYFICFCLILIGCENDIENSAEGFENDIVVNSIISTDSTFTVKLQYSKSIYDTTLDKFEFRPVEDAVVYIEVKEDKDDERTQDFFLDYEGDGIYTRGNFPIEGRNYDMVIEVDGRKTITAETYVPRVLEAKVEEPKLAEFNPDVTKLSYSVEISIVEDEKEEQNYYAWDLIPVIEEELAVPVDGGDEENNLGLSGQNVGGTTNPNIRNPSESPIAPKLSNAVPVLTDGGGKFTASIEVNQDNSNTTSGTQSSQGGIANPDTSSKQKYTLKVWAISYDYYQYLISIQQNTLGNSDSNRGETYSNVTNGSGIFAGYNLKTFPVEF